MTSSFSSSQCHSYLLFLLHEPSNSFSFECLFFFSCVKPKALCVRCVKWKKSFSRLILTPFSAQGARQFFTSAYASLFSLWYHSSSQPLNDGWIGWLVDWLIASRCLDISADSRDNLTFKRANRRQSTCVLSACLRVFMLAGWLTVSIACFLVSLWHAFMLTQLFTRLLAHFLIAYCLLLASCVMSFNPHQGQPEIVCLLVIAVFSF